MMTEEQSRPGPHQGQPILVAGEPLEGDPLEQTHVAMILLHGRGATADSMLELAAQWNQPDFTYLAPHAAGNSWYPYSFLAPLASNEPFLSSALALMEDALERMAQAGIPPERTMLCGFSQGACLALEFAESHRHEDEAGPVLGGYLQPDRYPRRGRGALPLWHPARSGSRRPGHERQFPDGGDQCRAAQERGKEAEGVNRRRGKFGNRRRTRG